MRLWICLILLLSPFAWADRCDPPAQFAQLLATLPDDNSERHKAIGEKLKSSSEDFWLNRLFLDGSVYERGAIREKYRLRFEANRSLDNEYLYGRSLVGFDTKQALRIYTDILEKDPENPWVHNSQLEIYQSSAFRDRSKLRTSFDAVTRVCPSWITPYRYLTHLDDDAMAPHAAKLRTLLEELKNPRDLRLYSTLWSAEFRLKTLEEKASVAADLKRLGEIDGTRATIASGARLIGDDALAKEMTPSPRVDVFQEQNAWQRIHPYPKPDDPPEKKGAYAQAELEASKRWIAEAPDRIGGYWDRLSALEMLDASAEQIASAAEDAIRVARTDDRAAGAGFIAGVAERYVNRGIQLDRVPGLIDEVLTSFDNPEAVIEIDLAPSPELTGQGKMRLVSDHVSALVTLSKYYEKTGNWKKARSVLDSVPAYLAPQSVPEDTRDQNGGHNLLIYHALAHHNYWKRMAELDEHENRIEDVLRDDRAALQFWDGDRDKLLAHQRGLWKGLGRSDEAWQAWVDSIPRPAWKGQNLKQGDFAAIHRPLPKVALKDLDGNEWPADRLAKTTIAVVWATWCEPCRNELPFFAKLAERLKDRTDVQVVSFNTDENPEVAKKFVEQQGYRFQVLAAKNFAEDLMPYFSIPRTWIIRNGVIVDEGDGFGGDGEQWVERVVTLVK